MKEIRPKLRLALAALALFSGLNFLNGREPKRVFAQGQGSDLVPPPEVFDADANGDGKVDVCDLVRVTRGGGNIFDVVRVSRHYGRMLPLQPRQIWENSLGDIVELELPHSGVVLNGARLAEAMEQWPRRNPGPIIIQVNFLDVLGATPDSLYGGMGRTGNNFDITIIVTHQPVDEVLIHELGEVLIDLTGQRKKREPPYDECNPMDCLATDLGRKFVPSGIVEHRRTIRFNTRLPGCEECKNRK